jgi:hypothetical protein
VVDKININKVKTVDSVIAQPSESKTGVEFKWGFGAESGKEEFIIIQTEDGSIVKYAPDDTDCKNPLEIITKTDSGRIISTQFKDGKKIAGTIMQDGISVNITYDEDENIITYARRDESFADTARSVGIDEESLAMTNPKACKNGWFQIGEKVKIPADSEEIVKLYGLEVDPKYEQKMFNKQALYNAERLEEEGEFPITLDKNTTYWELAKTTLIAQGNNNPNKAEISKLMIKIQKSNLDRALKAGTTVWLPGAHPLIQAERERFLELMREEEAAEQQLLLLAEEAVSLAGELYDDITSKKWGVIPTTRTSFKSNIAKINNQNAQFVLSKYDEIATHTLIEDIMSETGLSLDERKSYIDHINKALETPNTYDPNYHNPESQVNNPYHTGAVYDVSTDDNVITITNTSIDRKSVLINRQSFLNLEELLKDVKLSADKQHLKEIIQKLPGEVLEDLSIESSKLIHGNENGYPAILRFIGGGNAAGFYDKIDDIITTNDDTEVLVHELGHAIDSTEDFTIIRSASSIFNEELIAEYERELKAYLDAGNLIYEDNNDRGTYNTADIEEMVAESYTLMMLGYCSSEECILTHFPKTFELVKKHIAQIRSLSDYERHKK